MVYIGLRCRLEDRGGERLATLHAASRFIEQLSMFATVNRSCNLVDSFCPFGKVYLLSLTYSVVVADVVELSDYFRPYYLEFNVFLRPDYSYSSQYQDLQNCYRSDAH